MASSSEQLPVAQLESLKYRATQIMESITALQYLIEANGAPAMPPWPDILARYNLLLSQTHSLFVSLSSAFSHHHQQPVHVQQQSQQPQQNPFQKLVLHPSVAVPEQQLDNALAPLLRNQPTLQVLKEEDASVRRIAAVLKSATNEGVPIVTGPEGCERVVEECREIKRAHDARVERAVKAVALLRERYEWHARVEAGEEEQEEEQEGDRGKDEGGVPGMDIDGDVPMVAPAADGEVGVSVNARSSEASTPASSRSDEANEARVTEDVLGEIGQPPTDPV